MQARFIGEGDKGKQSDGDLKERRGDKIFKDAKG